MLNVYIVTRKDDYGHNECVEQTIVAPTEERAIELANKFYGIWRVERAVDLNIEQVLTTDWIDD